MTLRKISEPAAEPVLLADAKLQCSIDGNDLDAIVADKIASARDECEHELERALITQTWERVLDEFPVSEIALGMPPVQSIVSVRYIDLNGQAQTLDPSQYVLDSDTLPGFVLPADGVTWPATKDAAGAVRVRFVCGYGDTHAAIPRAIREWLLVRVASMVQFRSEHIVGTIVTALPNRHVDRLLDRYRVRGA